MVCLKLMCMIVAAVTTRGTFLGLGRHHHDCEKIKKKHSLAHKYAAPRVTDQRLKQISCNIIIADYVWRLKGSPSLHIHPSLSHSSPSKYPDSPRVHGDHSKKVGLISLAVLMFYTVSGGPMGLKRLSRLEVHSMPYLALVH